MSESSTASAITACIDGSGMTGAICDAAGWLSQRLSTPVRLLHVIEKSQSPVLEDLSGTIGLGSREQLLEELTSLDEQRGRLAMEHGRHLLADAEAHIREMGNIEVSSTQRHGSISEALQNYENETRAFVIGRRGEDHQTEPHRIGSKVETAVRAIHKPVLVAPSDFKAPERYMIAFDGSPESDRALDELAHSRLLSGLQGHLIMVGGKECRQQLSETCNRLVNQGMQVMAHLLQGELLPTLAQFQEEHNIDLRVMGAYSHSRFREFFVGSNTSRMISESKIPLLLLRRTED